MILVIVLFLCACRAFPGPALLRYTKNQITRLRLRYVYVSTVDGTARNCPSSSVPGITLAVCTAIGGLQRTCLMSMH
mgnify:CR=1 FL=1